MIALGRDSLINFLLSRKGSRNFCREQTARVFPDRDRPCPARIKRQFLMRVAIDGLGGTYATAKSECIQLVRVADRPAAHANAEFHESDGNGGAQRFPIAAVILSPHILPRGILAFLDYSPI
jgi:hypothetical protein